MRECLLVFKRRRHILHINNHLSVPQHEFHMSYTPSFTWDVLLAAFHKINIQEKCGKCEWLEVVLQRNAFRCRLFMWHDFNVFLMVRWRTSEFFYRNKFRLFLSRLEMSEACDALKVSSSLLIFLSLFVVLCKETRRETWNQKKKKTWNNTGEKT